MERGTARCSARIVRDVTEDTEEKRGHSYSVRRASIARPRVSSSAYSRSPPTGRPLANRLTVTPSGLMVRAR